MITVKTELAELCGFDLGTGCNNFIHIFLCKILLIEKYKYNENCFPVLGLLFQNGVAKSDMLYYFCKDSYTKFP